MGQRKRKIIFEACANCGAKIEDDEKAIVIDQDNDLIFCGEECLHEFFSPQIDTMEEEHLQLRSKQDIPAQDFKEYEYILPALLNDPDEVWEEQAGEDSAYQLTYFIGEFLHAKQNVFYVAAVYLTEERPSFVFLHFPTLDERLVNAYRRGEQIYNSLTSEQGEDLSPSQITDVDDYPSKLYEDLVANRSEEDIDPDEFNTYQGFVQATLDHPHEVWRDADEFGEGYVIYIAHFENDGERFAYIVLTTDEDHEEPDKVLFALPTLDEQLVNRIRVGKNILKREEEF